MRAQDFKGHVVLITGASSGIGEALARRFARDGARLVLVARRADRLNALAEELRRVRPTNQPEAPARELSAPTRNGSCYLDDAADAIVIPADLVEDGAGERILSQAEAAMGPIDVLVNNAGVGEYGEFAAKDLAAFEHMMRLNMNALVRLTHLALPGMLARRRGWIMNIASLAGFQPTPYMTVYGATKAFVKQFSLGLWEEVRRRGVVVTCVCPGPVKTGFFSRGGYETRMKDFTRLAAEAGAVAQTAHRALSRKKPVCVPGRLNALGVFLERFAPLSAVTRLAGKVLGPD